MTVKFEALKNITSIYKKGVEDAVKKATQSSETVSGETTPEEETLPLE